MTNQGFWITLKGKSIHIKGDPNISDADLDALMKVIQTLTNGEVTVERTMDKTGTSLDFPKDLGFECSMCGKPMEYRYCGMCPHCEMVWNG